MSPTTDCGCPTTTLGHDGFKGTLNNRIFSSTASQVRIITSKALEIYFGSRRIPAQLQIIPQVEQYIDSFGVLHL